MAEELKTETAVADPAPATAKEETVETPAVTSPEVMIGEDVLWWPKADLSHVPCAAKVVAVSGCVVDLVIYVAGGQRTEMSVPHIADPRFETTGYRFRDQGAWDLHPLRKKLDECYAVLEEMGAFGKKPAARPKPKKS